MRSFLPPFLLFSAIVLVTFLQITKILRLLLKMSPEHFSKKTQRHLESSNEFTAAPCPRNFDWIHPGSEQFWVTREGHLKVSR